MKPSQDEIEEALEGDSCGCWDGCKCGGGDKVIVLRAAYRSKCAELGKSEESLKIKHFSSCSDGSCDDTCGVAYANHFDCWLKERTHSIRAKIAAAEKERDRYRKLFELPSAAPELQRKLTAAMKLLQEYSHWHDKNIPNRDYPELCRCRLCCEHADMKRAALSKSSE